ncbi:VP2 [Tasmanian devil-associated polyomavirus 1]|nr:VP2 [Tasmanian devil-associated polyomavirus 1]
MGGVASIIFELIELGEIVAGAGLGAEALLSGELAEILLGQLEILQTIEGFTLAEALTNLGLSAQAYTALISTAAGGSGLITEAASAIGTYLSAALGASLIAAGLSPLDFSYARGEEYLMATDLIPWFPDVDFLYPGTDYIVSVISILDPYHWGPSLFNALGRYLWDTLRSETGRQLGHMTREVASREVRTFRDLLARFLENVRWSIVEIPRDTYNFLGEYYRELPRVRPSQYSQLYEKLDPQGRRGQQPYDEFVERNVENSANRRSFESGEYVEAPFVPGGAGQDVTMEWMLPLILGLYGDIVPEWEEEIREIEHEEDMYQSKQRSKKRKMSKTNNRAKTPYSRRDRSVGTPNRTRRKLSY